MGGGEASGLMDTAEAIRAEMPIEKTFFTLQARFRQSELTSAGQHMQSGKALRELKLN